MIVEVYDPVQKIGCAPLTKLARISDILSIHAELNDTTRGLINAEVFNALPEGAVLVNTARGAIVDEPALIQAINSGRLAGAGLDVLVDEHNVAASPIVQYARWHPNIVVTPHIGGNTIESVRDTDLFIVNKLKQWMEANHVSQNNR